MEDQEIPRTKLARRILEIRRRYGREPTANELLALHSLPCRAHSELWDRSQISIYIYQRLRHVETSGDVSVLEEAGRLLTIQRTATPPAGTTMRTESRAMVAGREHEKIPGYQHCRNHDLPLRPRSGSVENPAQNFFTHVNTSENSANISVHNDDLTFSENCGSAAEVIETTKLHKITYSASDSVMVNYPSKCSANYPDSLTTAENPCHRNKHWPFVDAESAEIARMNENMLGGGSL